MEKKTKKNETHNTWSRWNFLGGAFKDFWCFFWFSLPFCVCFLVICVPRNLGDMIAVGALVSFMDREDEGRMRAQLFKTVTLRLTERKPSVGEQ